MIDTKIIAEEILVHLNEYTESSFEAKVKIVQEHLESLMSEIHNKEY